MLQVGEKVIYGIHGVCTVEEFSKRIVDGIEREYLVLQPADQAGSQFFIPLHNPNAMAKVKNVLSPEELESLLTATSMAKAQWIPDENQRKQTYREAIGKADRTILLNMIHALYLYKKEEGQSQRKMHLCDENFLRDAERLVCSEIRHVMGLEPNMARNLLRSKLGYE